MRTLYSLVISFLLLSSVRAPAYAEASSGRQDQHVIDSLQLVIEEAKHDTSVCSAYISWGEQVYLNDADTALILWRKGYDIAKENLAAASPLVNKRYQSTMAEASNNMGVIYEKYGDIKRGLEYYDRSLRTYEEIDDKEGAAMALNNIAIIYINQGDIDEGLKYFHNSLKIREEIGDKYGIANSLNNIGLIYNDKGDTEKGLEYFRKSLNIKKEIGDKSGMAISLQHIGGSLCELDSVEKGIGLLKSALQISKELKDGHWMGYSCNIISNWYFNIKMIDSAEYYADLSLKIAQDLDFPLSIQGPAFLLFHIYRKQGKYQNLYQRNM
ncbi:MAG: tetratricopeptide repeat protein [Flavobacteriales bacterium]|nr:tetratricopeptide repeat protein [Flavobacteriales bacterium]